MEQIVQKTRYTREGCRVTTVVRKNPETSDMVIEEITLQCEDLIPQVVELAVEEEDTGRWLTGGM